MTLQLLTGRRVLPLALLLALLGSSTPAFCQIFSGQMNGATAEPTWRVNWLNFRADIPGDSEFEMPLNDPPGQNFSFNQPARAFAVANIEVDRFYVGLVTGRSLLPVANPKGVTGLVHAVYQTETYVKGDQTPDPTTFTTTLSYLELKAATSELWARMYMHADLCAVDQILWIDALGTPQSCVQQAVINVRIDGRNDSDADPDTDNHTYRLTEESVEGGGLTAGSFEVIKRGDIQPTADGARYELPSQVGTFGLTLIRPGEGFFFRYVLIAEGIALDEGSSRVFVGDPLDVNPGISMQIGAGIELANPQPNIALQQCGPNMVSATPDNRFVVLANNTANDTETGLNWPRCPQGHLLDTAGTIDLADDSCVADTTTEFTWQGALQESVDAATRSDYGNADWRLPNAKELTTLVESACSFPAMNTNIFPATSVGNIWTNTPSDFDLAFAVEFDVGRLDTLSQVVALSGVRLVRSADDVPPPMDDQLFADGFESAP